MTSAIQNFISANDLTSFKQTVEKACQLKRDPYAFQSLGRHKTLALLFLNPSLRTRLSSQKAAMHLGMNCLVVNVNQEGWKLEFSDGTVMDSDSGEHIKEAAQVIAQYADIIGVRCFPGLINREEDYQEQIIGKFVEYSGKPVISLESATRHPLQGLADMVTIEELKSRSKPKVVLSWAPHVKALPQSVPNSFVESCLAMDYELVITHPETYELDENFTKGTTINYNQREALEGADFVYVKNWSSFKQYGQIIHRDPSWMMTREKMELTNSAKFMHCLPIRRNLVAEDAVLDHPSSVVAQQANNRTFAMQAVLMELLERIN